MSETASKGYLRSPRLGLRSRKVAWEQITRAGWCSLPFGSLREVGLREVLMRGGPYSVLRTETPQHTLPGITCSGGSFIRSVLWLLISTPSF